MTKLQLLQQVSEADIFAKYIPGFNPNAKKNYKSPFGDKDNKPSLSIYKENGSLKFKSHNTGNQGDVFQFVADMHNLNSKKDFKAVLDIITNDLLLNNNTPKPVKKQQKTPQQKQTVSKKNVRISYEKAYTPTFLKYFKNFKIDAETLTRFDVKQVKYHEFISSSGKLCKFDYRKPERVAVCYVINEHIKTYFPAVEKLQEKSFGFKDQTTADVFGIEQIRNQKSKIKNLFVAAGEKDALALNACGFAAIAFQSENTIPADTIIKEIYGLASSIYVVYDNDEAGRNAADKLAKKTGWKVFNLPEGFKDVADFFVKNTAKDFEVLLSKPAPDDDSVKSEEEETSWTVFHSAEKYLSKHYDIRFNSIKLELEIKPKNEADFLPLNENSLYVEMNKAGIKVGMDKLIAILKSDYVERYNPFINYFKSLPKWDGKTDYIQQLCDYVDAVDKENFPVQFSKWMMRAVKCATVEGYYNKQAFILIHNKQNSGKTSFCRFLCPPSLSEYFAENISDDKDSRIAIAKNFLINLDELSSLHKSEINSLKALFSKDIINERLPYDRKNSIIHRVSSFIGSTNMAEFLTDETGSVRWLCFEIKGINWDYSKKVDIDKCWAQAVGMVKEGIHTEMSREEIEQNEARNKKFQQLSTEAEMIPKFFIPSSEEDNAAEFLTATDILLHMQLHTPVKLNKIMIGRAMPLCGFARVKDSKTDRYGYFVIKKQ